MKKQIIADKHGVRVVLNFKLFNIPIRRFYSIDQAMKYLNKDRDKALSSSELITKNK